MLVTWNNIGIQSARQGINELTIEGIDNAKVTSDKVKYNIIHSFPHFLYSLKIYIHCLGKPEPEEIQHETYIY